MKFKDSIECQSHAHCNQCRQKEGGRHLRRAWGRLYGLPGDMIDFDCPYGIPWLDGEKIDMKSFSKKETRRSLWIERITICKECEYKKDCEVMVQCCGRRKAKLKSPRFECPRGKFGKFES